MRRAGEGEEGDAPEPWTGVADARAALSRGGAGGGSAAAAAAVAERAKVKRKRARNTVLEDSEDGSGEESWSDDERPKRAKAKGRKRVMGGSDESE